jgi:DNA-binding CsgD family transcriptional regulator
MTLGVQAHALALLGKTARARAVLSEIDGLGVPAADLLGPEILQARAWTEVADRDLVAARQVLDEAVAMARWSGAYALESGALHDLARLGRAEEVAARLGELTGMVDGDLAVARAHHTSALAVSDATGLDEASLAFEAFGAVLLAAEAAADAATAWRRRAEHRRATASERRNATLAGRCEGATTPSLATRTPIRAALTPRELEIARLAAAGLADKEIAGRLYLSHRTVENRLHTVYDKLGVAGRSELAEVLGHS